MGFINQRTTRGPHIIGMVVRLNSQHHGWQHRPSNRNNQHSQQALPIRWWCFKLIFVHPGKRPHFKVAVGHHECEFWIAIKLLLEQHCKKCRTPICEALGCIWNWTSALFASSGLQEPEMNPSMPWSACRLWRHMCEGKIWSLESSESPKVAKSTKTASSENRLHMATPKLDGYS